MPRRTANLEADSGQYQVVSILDRYCDPNVFFRSARALSGISEPVMNETYFKLTNGCFTRKDPNSRVMPGRGAQTQPLTENVRYPELHPARFNWMEMRMGWVGSGAIAAHEYENDFVVFQVYTENCCYLVAEHLARYRAIYQQAGQDVARLMDALTEQFAKHDYYHAGNGVVYDFASILLTGLVVATTTVISGGAAGIVLASVVTEMIGEAAKTAQATRKENKLQLDDHYYLWETAKQYLEAVDKIERDATDAVRQLLDSLRRGLEEIRHQREYQVKPTGDETVTVAQVPHYRHYL